MKKNVYEIRTEMPNTTNGRIYDGRIYDCFTVHASNFAEAVTKANKSSNMLGEERIAEVILLARGDE
jgi:hypothetical protein